MKTIYMSMTALAALAVAAPLSAQPWRAQTSHSAELQMQLDAGIRTGEISGREAQPLRNDLRRLVMLERQFAGNGISGQEQATLQQRSAALHQRIAMAGGGDDGDDFGRRAEWDARYDREHRAGWEDRYLRDRQAQWDSRGDRDRRSDRNDRAGRDDRFASNDRFDGPNRGDRFAGDVRVGQRSSNRMMALPAEYRDDYRDSDSVYYRYDDDRIYRVDRSTGLILGMLDLPN